MNRRICLLLAIVSISCLAAGPVMAGKYCLAFWRETGFYEKGGIGGNHVINIHVWDENGNPLSGKHIYVGTLDLGTTDANGQMELAIYEPNAYPLKVVDGSHTSDTTPGFSSTRAPDWGHYCFECGFVYKSDTGSLPSFDLTYDGILNSSSADYACNNIQMSAPKTKSLAFCSTRPDPGFYCSDGTEGGSTVASVGQTFKATGNRVVAVKFHALGGNAQYTCRIREGGPTGSYVGAAATSPYVGTYEYGKTLTKWGLEAVPVVPGNTYYLEITKLGGGTFSVNKVSNDNYSFGCYYEGTTPVSTRELRGEVVCATVGAAPGTGTISGSVKNISNLAIPNATITTSPGNYNTTSDANGNYTLTNVSEGAYSVTASRTGYNPQTVSNINVAAGQTSTCNFTLTSNLGSITGYVRDSNGTGISGANVAVDTGGFSASTDSNGSYTILNIPAGTYSLTASKTGYSPKTNSGVVVSAGQAAQCSFVLVCAPPTIVSHPQSQTRTVQQSAVFSVSVTGTQPISYRWRKNGANISGATASSYSIHMVTSSDAGSYDCVVSNACGSVTTNAAVLKVNTGTSGVWDSDKVWTSAMNPMKLSQTRWGMDTGTGTSENWGLSYSAGVVYDRNNIGYALIADNNGDTSNSSKIKYRSDSGEGWTFDNTKTTVVKAGFYGIDSAGSYPSIYIRLINAGCQIRYDDVEQAWVPGDYAVIGSGSPARLSVPLRTWHYIRFQMDLQGNWQAWLNEDQGQRMWGTSSGTGGGYVQIGCLGSTNSNCEFGLDFVAWGQGASIAPFGTGTVTGLVKDQNDNAVAGATVSTTSGGYSTVTAANGSYSFPSAATGVYDITVSKAGYTSQTQTGLAVNMGQTTTVNFTLPRLVRDISDIHNLKTYPDGEYIRITGKVVSAGFADCFYLEEASRASGIKVTGASASEGSTVTVTGTLSTVNGERVISNAVVE